LTFQPSDEAGDLLRVWYGWHDGTKWSAPGDARLAFFGQPLLYKVQAAALVPLDTDLKTADPCRRFLEEFLTVVEPALVSRGKSSPDFSFVGRGSKPVPSMDGLGTRPTNRVPRWGSNERRECARFTVRPVTDVNNPG